MKKNFKWYKILSFDELKKKPGVIQTGENRLAHETEPDSFWRHPMSDKVAGRIITMKDEESFHKCTNRPYYTIYRWMCEEITD